MKNIMLFSFFVFILNLSATIINIPADYPTIQEGIIMSTESDTVLVSPGTYYENIYYYMKNITVASLFLTTQDTTYISQTIIDGNQNGSVVTFVCCVEDSTSVLCGFTIQNGYSDLGGGIYIEDSNSILTMPILENLIIKNNYANFGGGISIDYSYTAFLGPILKDLIIEDNSSYDSGGGIAIFGSTLSLERVTISNNNTTLLGGGIFCIAACVELIQVKIQNNSMEGLYGLVCESMYMNNVIISDNTGRGIFCTSEQFEVRDAIITNNLGGGLFLGESKNILENVLINDNGSESGGGICISGGETIIVNSTITSNFSNYGIIGAGESKTLLLNSILWENEPEQVFLSQGNFPTTLSTHYSCIENGENGILSSSYWPVFWGEGNIESDPLFINPEEDDFHLQDSSSCIGAGIETIELYVTPFFPSGVYYAPEYDIEGNPRPDPAGTMLDMGAYENPLGEPQGGITNNQLPVTNYQLSNYPNPFNPETKIVFNLPEEGKAKLEIYNVKGQKVKTLLDCYMSPGRSEMIWNGKDNNGKLVGSGIYFYKLQTPAKSYVKKCMLLK